MVLGGRPPGRVGRRRNKSKHEPRTFGSGARSCPRRVPSQSCQVPPLRIAAPVPRAVGPRERVPAEVVPVARAGVGRPVVARVGPHRTGPGPHGVRPAGVRPVMAVGQAGPGSVRGRPAPAPVVRLGRVVRRGRVVRPAGVRPAGAQRVVPEGQTGPGSVEGRPGPAPVGRRGRVVRPAGVRPAGAQRVVPEGQTGPGNVVRRLAPARVVRLVPLVRHAPPVHPAPVAGPPPAAPEPGTSGPPAEPAALGALAPQATGRAHRHRRAGQVRDPPGRATRANPGNPARSGSDPLRRQGGSARPGAVSPSSNAAARGVAAPQLRRAGPGGVNPIQSGGATREGRVRHPVAMHHPVAVARPDKARGGARRIRARRDAVIDRARRRPTRARSGVRAFGPAATAAGPVPAGPAGPAGPASRPTARDGGPSPAKGPGSSVNRPTGQRPASGGIPSNEPAATGTSRPVTTAPLSTAPCNPRFPASDCLPWPTTRSSGSTSRGQAPSASRPGLGGGRRGSRHLPSHLGRSGDQSRTARSTTARSKGARSRSLPQSRSLGRLSAPAGAGSRAPLWMSSPRALGRPGPRS